MNPLYSQNKTKQKNTVYIFYGTWCWWQWYEQQRFLSKLFAISVSVGRRPRGIAVLSVDKFRYLRKQTRGNEFIPCLNYVCHILICLRSFKTPCIPLICHKSSHGREPDGVTTCYPIPQDGGANRWQENTGRYGKTQKVSIYSRDPMNGQQLSLWHHTFAR